MSQQIRVKAMEFLLELIINLFISYFPLCFQTILAKVALVRLTILLVPNLWFNSIMADIKINSNNSNSYHELNTTNS